MTLALDLVAPVAAARARGFGLGVHRAPVSGAGWRPATMAARDETLRERLLAATAAGAGTTSRAVAATWHVEKHAWFVAGAALAGTLAHGAMPPLDELSLLDGEHGWAEAVGLPADGWRPADGEQLAVALAAHLAPLVDALAAHRPRRALWRSAGDRLGQAALWCGDAFGNRDAAWALAADAFAAPTPLRAPTAFELRDGEPFRRRTGCCLSHRCAAAVTCDDCPLSAGSSGTARAAGSSRPAAR